MPRLLPDGKLMLYVFAGFPGRNAPCGSLQLHAGRLEYCFETVEDLAILEHDPNVQYRKEGVFTSGKTGEFLYHVEYRMSELCLRDGITWEWFPESFDFGNGVTCGNGRPAPNTVLWFTRQI